MFSSNGKLLYHLRSFSQSNDSSSSSVFFCDYSSSDKKSDTQSSSSTIDDINLDEFSDDPSLSTTISVDHTSDTDNNQPTMYELKLDINEGKLLALIEVKKKTISKYNKSLKQNIVILEKDNNIITYENIAQLINISCQEITDDMLDINDEYSHCISFLKPYGNSIIDSSIDCKTNDEEWNDNTLMLSSSRMRHRISDETFTEYTLKWKLYMSDISYALLQVLDIPSKLQLRWQLLITNYKLSKYQSILSFCQFLLHIIQQILKRIKSQKFLKREKCWTFRSSCIDSYQQLIKIHIQYENSVISHTSSVELHVWNNFWESHYQRSAKHVKNITCYLDISRFLFCVIFYSPNITDNEYSVDNVLIRMPSKIMHNMHLPSAVLSLYLELFLYWFVTLPSHKWSWNGQTDDEQMSSPVSKWQQMTAQMKMKINYIFENADATKYPGYHWRYLLDYDALQNWLQVSEESGYGVIGVDWNHDTFDQLLSNPLNQIEQLFFPTLQYFVNIGGQLMGCLRDFVCNTTQHTHAFLICRVTDAILNFRPSVELRKQKKKIRKILKNKKLQKQEHDEISLHESLINMKKSPADDEFDEIDSSEISSDSSDFEPTNNEWIVYASRLLKLKIFMYLLPYNHHVHMHLKFTVSQSHYLISLYDIVRKYHMNGYSLNDMTLDLPLVRILSKYLLSEIEGDLIPGCKKSKSMEEEKKVVDDGNIEKNMETSVENISKNPKKIAKQKAKEKDLQLQALFSANEMFIAVMLFTFDVLQHMLEYPAENFKIVKEYIVDRQQSIHEQYFDNDFLDSVIKNAYFIVRIMPSHFTIEHLIHYCLFDIYERIVSQDNMISEQLNLIHKFQLSCTKILSFYAKINPNIELEIILLNGQLWYYVISSLLNRHVLFGSGRGHKNNSSFDVYYDIITMSVRWINFILLSIESLNDLHSAQLKSDSPQVSQNTETEKESENISLEEKKEQTPNSFTSKIIPNATIVKGQGYQRERTWMYEDISELASYPPKSTITSFINEQYLKPAKMLFFGSHSLSYILHLKKTLNFYLQILRLYVACFQSKISLFTNKLKSKNSKTKNDVRKSNKYEIFLNDVFPNFLEFDGNLFTFEYLQKYNENISENFSNMNINQSSIIDNRKKFSTIMIIAKKSIIIACRLAKSWELDVQKVRRHIIVSLCNAYKENIGLQLMRDDIEYNNINDDYDTNNKHLLAQSLLNIVKKRLCFYIQQLLHSHKFQHVLAEIPADIFQDLLHFNDDGQELSAKDKKEIVKNANKVLQMNLKLCMAINSLLQQQCHIFQKESIQEITTVMHIINLLLQKT